MFQCSVTNNSKNVGSATFLEPLSHEQPDVKLTELYLFKFYCLIYLSFQILWTKYTCWLFTEEIYSKNKARSLLIRTLMINAKKITRRVGVPAGKSAVGWGKWDNLVACSYVLSLEQHQVQNVVMPYTDDCLCKEPQKQETDLPPFLLLHFCTANSFKKIY